MIRCLLLLTLSLQPIGMVETCDMIELNHKHGECGNLNFVQVIFWKWYSDEASYHVREWRIADESIHIERQRKMALLFDRERRVIKTIKAKHFKESWTTNDLERDDKKQLDENSRELFAPRRLPKELPIWQSE